MDEEPLYTIAWTNFITGEPCKLEIWGNADKTDSRVYYTCLINSQTTVITNLMANGWIIVARITNWLQN